ncbi:hypothetical protein PENSTE_c003G03312 [Penicillium steckii]|uniref:serine--tRNA ligase n=1 Tax=Penicillium steckii TaxID=303698 RepID=A0A1V6TQY7_9EURO|nr:hypothetical protein PENSTE_c003G03312 [Penicillium steckii]
MATPAGLEDSHPVTIITEEDEPLLGQVGDLNHSQEQHEKIIFNFISGTATVVQAGIWILAILIWADLLSQPIALFTGHPLLGISALLLQVQAALILQPTSTPRHKILGTRIHAGIQLASLLCFLGAFTIIEINKGDHPHFVSPHGILGLLTVIFVVLQALVGIAQFFFPVTVFGSVDAGKRIYKYHRWSGYVLLLLETALVLAATQTGALAIPTWLLIQSTRRLSRPRTFAGTRQVHQIPRPPTAPKPIPDLKNIRQNADLHASNCIERNYAAHAIYPSKIQSLSEEVRALDHDLKSPRSRIKQLEKTIAKLSFAARQESTNAQQPSDGTNTGNVEEEISSLKLEAQKLKDESHAMTVRQSDCAVEINRLALSLPNLSSAETPVGDHPRLIEYINLDPNKPPTWTRQSSKDLTARSHVTIGTELGLIDFASSATTTGWGWYFLVNEGAMLEQALVQYALSVARRRRWRTVAPPSIVYSYIAEACGFQPRDQHNEQQIWSIEQSDRDRDTKPQRSLTGTAEIPLAAMYAGRDLNATDLPIKMVGASRCYRAEAGSRGVDTKGLYRVHEFTKVEMFGWADNNPLDSSGLPKPTSDDLFSELLDIQTEILTSLHLPCRVLEMPTTDLGASASRKRDIEALFPSRYRPTATPTGNESDLGWLESAWGEVTSASICTDYQSRRLATRVRGGTAKESRFPHTVNGTAMAVPRVLAAILENNWDAENGVVVIPEVLRPWMDGMETIGRPQ